MASYQLMVQFYGKGELKPTSWAPRSYKSANALYYYHIKNWPMHSYWLRIIEA